MIPSPSSLDEQARLRIRTSLSESFLVEAAAGTGKTTELVTRILNTLRSGVATIDRIVAVTFTNKAAGELKLRLRQALDRARAGAVAPEFQRLDEALARLEEASIGTIHSFCARILRERPVEARVDPDFQELTEPDARRLYEQVFRRWLETKLNEDSPGVRRALARLAHREERSTEFTPFEQLRNAGWRLIEWRDFPAPWQRMPMNRQEVIDQLCDAVQALDRRSYSREAMEPVRDMTPWIERRPRDYDMLEAHLLRLHRVWKRQRKPPSPQLYECLSGFRRAAEADLAAELRQEMWTLVTRYDEAKRRAGKLDFLDLLLLVRDLVRDNQEVRTYLQERFSRLFVDEFQDTDPLQAEILLLLSADDSAETDWLRVTPSPGKLFVVGDPKQSVYKFRRADVHLYQNLRQRLEERGVATIRLSRSFRSVRTIQRCVNAAFEDEMNGDRAAAQADYVPLEEFRADLPGQPAVVALPAPRPYGMRNISKAKINECLPATIVGFVDWLLRDSGWKVQEPETGELIPIRSRDICLLFRRFTNFGQDLTRDYVRGLEDRGIEHLLVGSKSFHAREEIDTLRAALTAVEWPDDELAVYAALRGAFFSFHDATLLRYRHEAGRLHPFHAPMGPLPEALQQVADALAMLRELHLKRNRRPIAETAYLLAERTRTWAAFALRPAGRQSLANVRRVIDLARQFETSGGISFRGFVEELAEQAERAESAEAPVLEEGAEGVRLMTVHTAKGLEAPVVILADMTANLSHEEPDRHVDAERGLCAMRLLNCLPKELIDNEDTERMRERAEGVRVAYVAATRARDLLVVPTVGDEEREGWLEPLNAAVYPQWDQRRRSKPAPGCPEFGEESVLDRPPERMQDMGVRPGLHVARKGGHNVVWWDPAALPPGAEEFFGRRQEEILADDRDAAAAGLADHEQWRRAREQRIETGAKPSVEVWTATEAPPPDVEREVHVESANPSPRRPSGKRFGALLHAVLGEIPLQAGRAEIEAIARLQGRILASPKEEVEAAVRAVENALRHPLLERARASARVHREYPVVLRRPGQPLVEGVIDLAFEEPDRWVVVDFKTDTDLEFRLPEYRAQISWYAIALEQIKAKPVDCRLLQV